MPAHNLEHAQLIRLLRGPRHARNLAASARAVNALAEP
jgi:hypothetical protein